MENRVRYWREVGKCKIEIGIKNGREIKERKWREKGDGESEERK